MNLASLGSFSSLATTALDTARSTFKGLADAASSEGASAGTAEKTPVAEKPQVKTEGQAEATAAKPKGIRLGTLLDAYA